MQHKIKANGVQIHRMLFFMPTFELRMAQNVTH